MADEPLESVASVLLEELKNGNTQLQLNSMRSLCTIASALGEERTRRELIPVLWSKTDAKDDQVLLAMAEVLGVFIPYVGGVEHASVLLPPLEQLCCRAKDKLELSGTSVRDKAVESLCRIGSQMKESDLVEYFIPLVKRLAESVWFTARVSACGLLHIAYKSASEASKKHLRKIYSNLCQDDNVVVKSYAATNLVKVAATVEYRYLKAHIMSIFEDLTRDDIDSIRVLAVEGCAALVKLLEPQDCVQHILPVFVNLPKDESWRVRCMVANKLYDVCEAVGPEPTRAILVPAYVLLLEDNEAKVRIAAAGKVTKLCQILSPDAIQHILPCIKVLSSDLSQNVRSALASVIVGLAPVLGKDSTLEHLLPIFVSLLKDEILDVRVNIIDKLAELTEVIELNLLCQRLFSATIELSELLCVSESDDPAGQSDIEVVLDLSSYDFDFPGPKVIRTVNKYPSLLPRVPKLVAHLRDSDDNIKKQAAWVLGSIACDSRRGRKLILENKVLLLLLSIVKCEPITSIVSVCAKWIVISLCKEDFPPNLDEEIRLLLPYFRDILVIPEEAIEEIDEEFDGEIQLVALRLLDWFTPDYSSELYKALIEADVYPHIVNYLFFELKTLLPKFALRIIDYLVRDDDGAMRKILVENDALLGLRVLLREKDEWTLEAACGLVGHFATDQLQAVLDHNLVSPVVNLLKAESHVKKEAAMAICQVSLGNQRQIWSLSLTCKYDCLKALCDALNFSDPVVIDLCLESLENFLRQGYKHCLKGLTSDNIYAQFIEHKAFDGLLKLHSMDENNNALARRILVTYFGHVKF